LRKVLLKKRRLFMSMLTTGKPSVITVSHTHIPLEFIPMFYKKPLAFLTQT
jgi:hypothetical protein